MPKINISNGVDVYTIARIQILLQHSKEAKFRRDILSAASIGTFLARLNPFHAIFFGHSRKALELITLIHKDLKSAPPLPVPS